MRLPPDWELLHTSSGRSYFWNRRTNQTTWHFPKDWTGTVSDPREEIVAKGYVEKPAIRKERRFTVEGRCFLVEPMPPDHSCGFHGLGVERGTAASLLLANLDDPDVEEFLARDLLAALQTSSRTTFPPELRSVKELWEMLKKFYQEQEALDLSRREAREFMVDAQASAQATGSQAKGPKGLAEGSVDLAIKHFYQELKTQVRQEPSSSKLFTLQLLAQCKAQERELHVAGERSKEALETLRLLCKQHLQLYVNWVGSDSTFWLSFIRATEGDGGGGLLDAIAKVAHLTVRVWGEEHKGGRLTLLHTAPFGGRDVDLWYRDLNHFDRLVLCG